jgi:hypothetical protein
MHQHALRTAATLYVDGTWTRDAAAKYAGVRPIHLDETVENMGMTVPETPTETREPVPVTAD